MKKLGFIIPSLVLLLLTTVGSASAQINLNETATTRGFAPPAISVGTIISWALGVLFAVAALAAVAFLIWGGIKWITSGGDKGKVEAARNTIVAAIIGIIVVVLSFVILNFVIQILGFGQGIFSICIPTLSQAGCVQ